MKTHFLTVIITTSILAIACSSGNKNMQQSTDEAYPCANALITYSQRYPAAEPTDLYKLVFQDLYGPGHLITDSTTCANYISAEASNMGDSSTLPLLEYTLCDSNFIRVNISLVRDNIIPVSTLTSAVLQSAQGLPTPEPRFVVSHSEAFRQAYNPHYRIVRRDIFNSIIQPLLPTDIIVK